MSTVVPLNLLLQYFEQATKQLLKLKDGEVVVPSESTELNWHRNRIVKAQLLALSETLSKYEGEFSAEAVQAVLREVGTGNFNNVASIGDDEVTLVKVMENTNETAREAFARSVLFAEMQSGSNARDLHTRADLDRSTLMEFFGLAMSCVRIPEIQRFLLEGKIVTEETNGEVFSTPEERLLYIQRALWRALGWDPDAASDHIKLLVEGGSELMKDKEVAETFLKYMSSMTVAATNASMGNDLTEEINADGTTRVVNVTYSEKVLTSDAVHSLSAPRTNEMNEHTNEQQSFEQRQQRDVAKLRQDIHEEFTSLSPDEQRHILVKAKQAHDDFLQSVLSTPPGADRVTLMKNIDMETQKLLIIHKMCAE